MIKILFFIDTLAGGGAEKVLRTLVNNMDQSKFSITVQTLEEVNPHEYLVPGIRYKAINRCKTVFGKKLFHFWIRLCAELKWLYPLYIRDDYDIEVAYLECGSTKILAGSTNQRASKIAWVHCDLLKKEGFAAQLERIKTYYRAYDKVVCVSEQVMMCYRSMFGEEPQSLVLYNTVDDEEIRGKANASVDVIPQRDRPVAATVGRMYHQKGYDRLLEAHHKLLQDGIVYDLWILGEGPERGMLEKMVQDYGMEETVHFLGFQQNPYAFMKAADLIVCSSRYEGFSTVITEALILGKPVVTTPCSGMRELLGDSQYGLITEDSVDGIYSGMKKMLEDPSLRESYAQAAAQRGTVFSKAERIAETENFFRSVLEEKQKR